MSTRFETYDNNFSIFHANSNPLRTKNRQLQTPKQMAHHLSKADLDKIGQIEERSDFAGFGQTTAAG